MLSAKRRAPVFLLSCIEGPLVLQATGMLPLLHLQDIHKEQTKIINQEEEN
jgi:hypothetical protein